MNRDELRDAISHRLEQAKSQGEGIHLSADEVVALLPNEESTQYIEPAIKKECSIDDMQIRWLLRQDIPDVLQIEHHSYDPSWREEDFLNALRQRNCIGMVCEHRASILGFMIYELHKNRLRVLRMAVSVDARRQGVATAMVNRLRDKLHQQRRDRIDITVSDVNLNAHLFLRSCGFIGTPCGECIDFTYRLNTIKKERR